MVLTDRYAPGIPIEELAEMDKREFESVFSVLRSELSDRGNPDSFNLSGCNNCSQCMFCIDSDNCHGCQYTNRSQGCTHCSHINDSVNCHQSSHLDACERCVASHYLTLCEDCAECAYCFGCVGLVRKEFHILNEPYDRKTYFQMVKALRQTLGLKPSA